MNKFVKSISCLILILLISLSFVGCSKDDSYVGKSAGLYNDSDRIINTWDELIDGRKITIMGDKIVSATLPEIGTCLVIPNEVTTIGNGAFMNCDLKTIVLSEGIYNIESWAFAKSPKLKTVVMPSTIDSIGSNIFFDSQIPVTISYNGTKEQWSYINFSEPLMTNVAGLTIQCTNGDLKQG